jgi:histidine ammonia-lyase
VRYVLAIELLCAAQALDYRLPLRAARLVAEAHDRVRALVATLERDRVVSGDIEVLAAAIADGRFAELAGDEREGGEG